MAEEIQTHNKSHRSLSDVFKEIEQAVAQERAHSNPSQLGIKDLRWLFDQESAKMNQSIYNDQPEKTHQACLKTITVLIEILSRP